VTTHSTEVIRAADPDLLHLVIWDGSESTIESLDRTSIQDIRKILDEVGVSFSDLYGADNILLVEGPTEERCFPLILRHIHHSLRPGTAIVSIINTGDLEKKRARASLVWQIYEKLSNGIAFVPPALAFSFDRDGRTDTEIADMKRQSRGLVHFLPRRTYENFLIHADALRTVLSASMTENVSPEAVSSWLSENGNLAKYSGEGMVGEPLWLTTVNAPFLLDDLFLALSSTKVEYRKTVHSVQLTEWLLANEPESMTELAAHVHEVVGSSSIAGTEGSE
jgi:hypothetical protein